MLDFDHFTWPGAVVCAAFIIALAFGPNCAGKKTLTYAPNGQVGPLEETETAEPPLELIGPDLGPGPELTVDELVEGTRSRDQKRMLELREKHTNERFNACEAHGNSFPDCMWWVYGGEADVDPMMTPEFVE